MEELEQKVPIGFDEIDKKQQGKLWREYLRLHPKNFVWIGILFLGCLGALTALVFLILFALSGFENFNYCFISLLIGSSFMIIAAICMFVILPKATKQFHSWLLETKNILVLEKTNKK